MKPVIMMKFSLIFNFHTISQLWNTFTHIPVGKHKDVNWPTKYISIITKFIKTSVFRIKESNVKAHCCCFQAFIKTVLSHFKAFTKPWSCCRQYFFFFFRLVYSYSLFFFLILFIYFWLRWVFVAARGLSLVAASRATLCCGVRASHCGGFSCCGARTLGARASVVVAHRLSSCGSWALEHRLSSCGARA